MTVIGVMVAYQEAAVIGRALSSLAPFCDRLVVVDGARAVFPFYAGDYNSTDGTQDIARRLGAEVIAAPDRPWADEVEQRNAYHVGALGDWYLVLDADEIITGALPDLDGEAASYRVPIVLDDGHETVRRNRLYRHCKWTIYQYSHWSVYQNGVLMIPTETAQDLLITHLGRQDVERNERRMAYKPQARKIEGEFLVNGSVPQFAIHGDPMEMQYQYLGGGWVPGLPARDLTTVDVAFYKDLIDEHMRTPRPLYRKVTDLAPVPVLQAGQPDGRDLLPVRGIGEATSRRLAAGGVPTLEALVSSPIETITSAAGVNVAKAQAWQAHARQLLAEA